MNTIYKEKYDQLIQLRTLNKLEKSKEDNGSIETHHIIPLCCGGTNDKDNLINLYSKEHFMAHYYLWKIHENDEYKYKLLNAFWMMCVASSKTNERTYQQYVEMSEQYQEARIQFAKFVSNNISIKISSNKNGQYGKHWYYNPLTNESKPYISGKQPVGWILGRKYKDHLAFQQAVSKSNQRRAKQIKGNIIRIYNPLTNEERFINKETIIPEGFEHRGKPLSDLIKTKISLFHKKNSEDNIIPKRIKELRPMYSYYLQYGWNKFKEYYNYESSRTNFLQLCKRYLSEYSSRKNSRQGKIYNE